MDHLTAASAYREAAIASAPPIKLVRLLYQGALRFLDRGIACDPRDPRSRFVDWLTRADAVVAELRVSLVKEHAPEVAGALEQLYLYAEAEIQRALAERAVEPAHHARSVLATLLEAWDQVEVAAAA